MTGVISVLRFKRNYFLNDCTTENGCMSFFRYVRARISRDSLGTRTKRRRKDLREYYEEIPLKTKLFAGAERVAEPPSEAAWRVIAGEGEGGGGGRIPSL